MWICCNKFKCESNAWTKQKENKNMHDSYSKTNIQACNMTIKYNKNKQLKNSVLPLFWRNWRGSEWCEHDTLCCLIDGSRSLTLREKTEDFVYLRLQPFSPWFTSSLEFIHLIRQIHDHILNPIVWCVHH